MPALFHFHGWWEELSIWLGTAFACMFLATCFISVVTWIWWRRAQTANLLDARGRIVLITGCDSGVGLSLASYAHELGFHVLAGCLKSKGEGAALLRRLSEEAPERMVIVPLDVTRCEDVEALKEKAEEWMREEALELWAVVNNAGVLVFGMLEWLNEEQISMQIRVNLEGAIRVSNVFLPLLRKSKGRLISLTSPTGQLAFPGLAAYSATKAGIEGFSDALRREMKLWDVDVILFNPGDLSRHTQIMAAQKLHFDRMKSRVDQTVYGDFFRAFEHHIVSNFSPPQVDVLQDVGNMYSNFKEALLSTQPHSRYQNLSAPFHLFLHVTRLLPNSLTDPFIRAIGLKSMGYNP